MIYLVRHGQSEWNALRRTQGQTSHPPLTGLGRRQARCAAEAIRSDLGERQVAEIATSDLERALQTARIISEVVPGAIRLDPNWREQALGSLEGANQNDAFRAVAELNWLDPDIQIGGGESAHEVAVRTKAAFLRLSGAKPTVVVSHSDAIRSVLGWMGAAASSHVPWVEVANGAVVVVGEGGPPRWLAPANVEWLP